MPWTWQSHWLFLQFQLFRRLFRRVLITLCLCFRAWVCATLAAYMVWFWKLWLFRETL